MFHTRVCDLFGIEYPILQSPMNYPITPALIAAVSNAGGARYIVQQHADRPLC